MMFVNANCNHTISIKLVSLVSRMYMMCEMSGLIMIEQTSGAVR